MFTVSIRVYIYNMFCDEEKMLRSTTGLADATNTRTDTSARIHTVCKVAGDFYASLGDPTQLQSQKRDYEVLQSELLLVIGDTYAAEKASCGTHAYPQVISNVRFLGTPDKAATTLEKWYVHMWNARTWDELKRLQASSCLVKNLRYWPQELTFFGVSVSSRVHASVEVGDNACTSMLGGKVTIRNGIYPIAINTPVMWYIDAEADAGMFDAKGARKPLPAPPTAAEKEDKASFHSRTHDYGERANTKLLVYPKPAVPGIYNEGMSIMDWKRVFGIALSSAAPGGHVDVLLGRPAI